jgi:hypothetical protein
MKRKSKPAKKTGASMRKAGNQTRGTATPNKTDLNKPQGEVTGTKP